MNEFIIQVKEYGVYVALCNWLIGFTKWFIKAKRIEINYWRTPSRKGGVVAILPRGEKPKL